MRRVRVVSAALDQPDSADDRVRTNRESVLEALDLASTHDPDVVCFPEIVLQERGGSTAERLDAAEPIPGPATDAVGELAADLDAYVVLPTFERVEGPVDGEQGDDVADDEVTIYNSAVLVEPSGNVREPYHKLRPPISELDPGVVPGRDTVTWDTEFGTFAAVICFDVGYPEIGLSLARDGADVVFFVSQMDGGSLVTTWARDYGYHVVKSTRTGASIVTPAGHVVANATDAWPPSWIDLESGGQVQFAVDEINTDCMTCSTPDGAAHADLQRAEPVSIRTFDDERQAVVTSLDEDVSIEEVAAEYGLVDRRAYYDRAALAAREARPDGELGPSARPWLDGNGE